MVSVEEYTLMVSTLLVSGKMASGQAKTLDKGKWLTPNQLDLSSQTHSA